MTQSAYGLQESTAIQGVYFKPIRAFPDNRGIFREAFRKEWFPWVNFDQLQSNHSVSYTGVLRGLHYHFHQIDFWYVPSGLLRVGLVDLRASSPTFMKSQTLEIGETNETGIFIPEGVAHGFYAVKQTSLIYYVNQYFTDGSDENGVAWNDPDLGVAWNLPGDPIISARDAEAPRFRDLPPEKQPK